MRGDVCGVDSGREVAGSMCRFQRCCPPPPGCLHSPSDGKAALSPAHPQGVPSSLPSFRGSKCPALLPSYAVGSILYLTGFDLYSRNY